MRPRLAQTLPYVAVGLVLGGSSWAAPNFVGSDGQLHGCVSRKGRLVVVEPGKACRKGTSPIVWNQLGPKGDAGQSGERGLEGAAGTARAYAHVLRDGTLDLANSKNVLDVRPTCSSPCTSPPDHQAFAFLCFALGFTPQNAVVTTEIADIMTAARVQIPGQPVGPLGGCAPGYQDAEVFIFDTTTGFGTVANFYILFN